MIGPALSSKQTEPASTWPAPPSLKISEKGNRAQGPSVLVDASDPSTILASGQSTASS